MGTASKRAIPPTTKIWVNADASAPGGVPPAVEPTTIVPGQGPSAAGHRIGYGRLGLRGVARGDHPTEVDRRLEEYETNMRATLEGIKQIAEAQQ